MRIPDNSNLVIFGASGDLSFRKLIPALYQLYVSKQLPECFFILGVSRSDYSSESYREALSLALIEHADASAAIACTFLQHVYYLAINTSDTTEYAKLSSKLNELYDQYQTPHNTLYYLATPPSQFTVVPACLANSNLLDKREGWKRIVIEKPLGYDLQSAIALDKSLHSFFDESQIYRIDHYLGKETVQNLLVFRFANGMFEPLWDRNYVDYIEITGAESLGVEARGRYYEGAGALRDMLQNHLLQVLAMVAMEPPAVINADSTRNEVVKVLQSLQPISDDDLKTNINGAREEQASLPARGRCCERFKN
jgi:glucose-6-phosphate 1-dehydrogenase